MSKRWTGVAALAGSLSVVWLVFIILGSPWMGLMWVVSLAFTASLWANLRGTKSEPVPVIVNPTPIATPAPKAVL